MTFLLKPFLMRHLTGTLMNLYKIKVKYKILIALRTKHSLRNQSLFALELQMT